MSLVSESLSTSQRLTSVDALRGLAALAVCWFHLTGSTGEASPELRSSGAWGYLGVEAFFVISGFIIPYAMWRAGYTLRAFLPFMARRLTRLEPPYWASITVTLALTFALSHVARTVFIAPTAKQLALHAGYLIPLSKEAWLSPVYWTLGVEFQFYLTIALLFPLIASRHQYRADTTFALLIIIAILGRNETGILVPYLPLFVLGMALFRHRAKLATRDGTVTAFVLSVAFTGMVVGVPHMLAGLLAFVVIADDWLPTGRAVRFLGRISYSLYLIHWTVGQIAVAGLRHFGLSEWMLRFVALGVCLAAATIFYRLIEAPAVQWAKLIHYRPDRERLRLAQPAQ